MFQSTDCFVANMSKVKPENNEIEKTQPFLKLIQSGCVFKLVQMQD